VIILLLTFGTYEASERRETVCHNYTKYIHTDDFSGDYNAYGYAVNGINYYLKIKPKEQRNTFICMQISLNKIKLAVFMDTTKNLAHR
jgi:hypothetical protein